MNNQRTYSIYSKCLTSAGIRHHNNPLKTLIAAYLIVLIVISALRGSTNQHHVKKKSPPGLPALQNQSLCLGASSSQAAFCFKYFRYEKISEQWTGRGSLYSDSYPNAKRHNFLAAISKSIKFICNQLKREKEWEPKHQNRKSNGVHTFKFCVFKLQLYVCNLTFRCF